jgi:hypothetical protein
VIVWLRGLLGHDTWKDVKRWWEDRRADLKAVSIEAKLVTLYESSRVSPRLFSSSTATRCST